MIKLALKNSMVEQESSGLQLDEIEEMKCFYPTEEEFKSPIVYIEKLVEQGASQYGCIKVMPP